jgi:putative ABC transport system permease protein
MSRAFRFAWLSIVRQPSRALLGVLGIAAVGALLFDMLLLSRGLVLSFRDLLGREGFDVRVIATEAPPPLGPPIDNATSAAAAIAALADVEAVSQIRFLDVEIAGSGRVDAAGLETTASSDLEFIAIDPRVRSPWTILEGRDLAAESSGEARPLLVNRLVARQLDLSPGSAVTLRGLCGRAGEALPAVPFTVAGIAEFPFDDERAKTVGGRLEDVERLCGERADDAADALLVRSRGDADATAAAIRAVRPELHVATNEELVERFSRVEFSYFRQISFVLASVTVFFGFLLIAVLLTVSVNQRLGEIAALRALGLSRGRVVAGVLWESVMLVGAGGLLAIPFGLALSAWLDRILRALPGIPVAVSFFVFEPRALALHAALLAVAAVAAALYPMRIVATLPIAATLRREVVS